MDIPTNAQIQQAQQVVDELGDNIKGQFFNFLKTFRVIRDTDGGEQKEDEELASEYETRLGQMYENRSFTLLVDFQHLTDYDPEGDLAITITKEFYRLGPYLQRAAMDFVEDQSTVEKYGAFRTDDDDQKREVEVAFYNVDSKCSIRELRAETIGQLVSINGTVVRTSAVHPELISGTFQCKECATIIRDVHQQFKYTQPPTCSNPGCQNRIHFKLLVEDSQFADFQKVRIQESSDKIPSGSMPRSMDIILRHESVEQAKAGDKCEFFGTLIAIPDVSMMSSAGQRVQLSSGGRRSEGFTQEGIQGLRSLGVRDMTYRLAFLANFVRLADARAGQVSIRGEEEGEDRVIQSLTESERNKILEMKKDDDLYDKMCRSIAPAVYGHDEVKKGVLLMLLGGVHKTTVEGIGLRGDINVCVVGDPSTAKSQFLKYVTGFVPRSVYTSGKASSAAGLTAAVVKDEDTNEFYVEAGALMLADNGICCIDEFDKMDMRDQVAIHEAMEQQTISITKAGIQATLNARTSILAAANPIGGRYDRAKALKSNIAMTAPIMSRFDLFFVVLDESRELADVHIARHIVRMHRELDAAVNPPYSTRELQNYLRFARTRKPRITKAAMKLMVTEYRKLRQGDASGFSRSSYRITVRQLESMIRLSEALARLRLEETIIERDVQEACRLLRQSIIRVEEEDVVLRDVDEDSEDAFGDFPGGDDGDDGQDGGAGGAGGDGVQDNTDQPQVKIKHDTYTSIASQIIRFLRQREAEEESQDDDSSYGTRIGDIVGWWVEHTDDSNYQSNSENREQALLDEIYLIKLVIAHLVDVDGVLLSLGRRTEDGGDGGAEGDGDDGDDDVLLVVHPNYTE